MEPVRFDVRAKVIHINQAPNDNYFVHLFIRAEEGPLALPVGQDLLVYFEDVPEATT